ncbi:MAG: YiiD C-terminal domain-containing protein [Leptospiraceae bacterium]|nr:YiiD C-terminal domain-containing protein [Leptospiraceae bacterium]MCP5510623.1 YiiD C-terminal domain-containing protein [Leptospiraceae bacterium]
MEEKKNSRLDYEIFPMWKFMQDTFGIEEAFENFGPYKGANVKINIIDQNSLEVYMIQTVNNTNYVGTHFGGSLYSMCDPFYMFLLIWNLGEDYIVWDKSARIEFVSPGKGKVKVRFFIPDEEIQEIREIVAKSKKTTRTYFTEITDEKGKIVAKLEKELYIRRKK